jgi:transcriptional regulator with XRE-family HTH domain
MSKFQKFMDSRHLTQYQLHKRSGFTKSQVGEWARGKHRPSLSSVRRLALTLRLPLEDLMGQLEIRERTQNARTLDGSFVPKSRKNSTTICDTNDSGRTPTSYCSICGQILGKAA